MILSQTAGPADGLRILDRALGLRPQATAASHLRRALCLERAGDLAGRDRETKAAQELAPVTALDYFLTGRELAAGGQFADAIRLLETAVQRDLDQTSAHLLLAVCYLNVRPRQLSAATTSLNVCIRSHPDLVGLYLLRASIFGEEGSQGRGPEAVDAFEAAEADYRRALELKPDDEVRYALLANRGLLRLRSNRLDLAAADLNLAIRLKPDQYQAHTTLGQVLQSQGRLELAAAALGRAIACQPEPSVLAGIYRTRALFYAPRSDITPSQKDSALLDLAEAIRREPDEAKKASDHVWRARLYFDGGQSAAALLACDAALALVPEEPEAHRVRIAALMKLKRYEDVLDRGRGPGRRPPGRAVPGSLSPLSQPRRGPARAGPRASFRSRAPRGNPRRPELAAASSSLGACHDHLEDAKTLRPPPANPASLARLVPGETAL